MSVIYIRHNSLRDNICLNLVSKPTFGQILPQIKFMWECQVKLLSVMRPKYLHSFFHGNRYSSIYINIYILGALVMEDNLCFEPIGIRNALSILISSLLSLNHLDNLLMSSC